MVVGANLPAWVTPVAWMFLTLAVLSAAAIAVDISLPGNRQPSRAMELVWPITALYLGPLALSAYLRLGPPHRRARGRQSFLSLNPRSPSGSPVVRRQ